MGVALLACCRKAVCFAKGTSRGSRQAVAHNPGSAASRRPEPVAGDPGPQKKKPAPKRRASHQVVLRKRRYADLGHLLPMFSIEPAVQPGVSALPLGWPAINTLPRDSGLDNAPEAAVGHGSLGVVGGRVDKPRRSSRMGMPQRGSRQGPVEIAARAGSEARVVLFPPPSVRLSKR